MPGAEHALTFARNVPSWSSGQCGTQHSAIGSNDNSLKLPGNGLVYGESCGNSGQLTP